MIRTLFVQDIVGRFPPWGREKVPAFLLHARTLRIVVEFSPSLPHPHVRAEAPHVDA